MDKPSCGKAKENRDIASDQLVQTETLLNEAEKTEKEAEKNVSLKETNNRPTFNLEFFGKDSESSLNTSSTDYQSYGVNLTFKTPLFYNSSSKASIKKLYNLSRASSVELSEKLIV